LTEQGIDPASYTEAQLIDVGQAALIEQGQQNKVNTGSLLLMAHAAGALDIRTLHSNNKQAIHDQLMAFINTAFAEDFQIIEALTTLAQTPYPTRRQLAEDNLRAAGIRPSKKNVDLYMEADQLSSLFYREVLDGMIQKDALAASELRPNQNEESLRQAREKLKTQSLKEEFNTQFDQYEKVVSEQTTQLINASLSRYSKRHGIDLSAASITVSQTQQTVNLKKLSRLASAMLMWFRSVLITP
jgi:hypothetical protein